MGLVYHGAPGCSFKPSNRVSVMKDHLKRQTWCPCKDADWTVEKAKEGQIDARTCRPRKTPSRPPTCEPTAKKQRVISDKMDEYINVTEFLRDSSRNTVTLQYARCFQSSLEQIAGFLGVEGHVLIRKEGNSTYMHPMLLAAVARHKDDKVLKGLEGLVYITTSAHLNAVKIGMWRGTMGALRARYVTPYGPSVSIMVGQTEDCAATEKLMHKMFASSRLEGELFEKRLQHEYVAALKDLTDPVY